MLETYLQAPEWYRQHMGSTDLDEICPVLYQILPAEKAPQPLNSIYGSTTQSQKSTRRQNSTSTGVAGGESPADSNSFKPILPHQIFSKLVSQVITKTAFPDFIIASVIRIMGLRSVIFMDGCVSQHTHSP
jgi:hypothetical protein